MTQPSEAATSLPDALKQIKQLASDLKHAQNETRLRISFWEEAHSHLSQLHENRKKDDLKKLQDLKRENDELTKKMLLMSHDYHQDVQKLKSQNELNEEEISNMGAIIFDLRREKINATHRAEQNEMRMKNLQRRLDGSLNYVKLAGRKRGLSNAGDENGDTAANDNMDGTINTAKKARLASSNVVVPCTQCFTKGWPCDNGDAGGSCRNCQLRQKSAVCKRIMCKNYDGDECKVRDCTFAHENDHFRHVVNYTILKVVRQGKSPAEREAEESKEEK